MTANVNADKIGITKRKLRCFMLILAIISVFLPSCGDSAGEGGLYNRVMTLLGFDMNDYESETAIRFPDSDDEIITEIENIISILIYDSSEIYPFESTRDAAAKNGDAILNYMLRTSYSAYSGNASLLEDAEKAYPQYNITILIPENDYESCVYRYFGGDSSVQHYSTSRFTYLNKVGAYTTTGQTVSSDVAINITKCVETKHTYRVFFTLTDSDGTSVDYQSMIMKREDGTKYMKFLRNAETEK